MSTDVRSVWKLPNSHYALELLHSAELAEKNIMKCISKPKKIY